jgi:hypothetical protein
MQLNILILPILLVSVNLLANEPIQHIPAEIKVNKLQAELGKKLFLILDYQSQGLYLVLLVII